MSGSYQREVSRERSRDRRHGTRSPSEDSADRRRYKNKESKPKPKRVRFQENADIRVFRKEDQPIARGLTEEDLIQLKTKLEKQVQRLCDFNWDQKKHIDAQSENNSIKQVRHMQRQQKQKEKALNDKLMSAKEVITFYNPQFLKSIEYPIVLGHDSQERQAHSERIRDVFGCYYTHSSQIPNQPQFQILNTNNTSQPKIIKFDRQTLTSDKDYGNHQSILNPKLEISQVNDSKLLSLKGILKMPKNQKQFERGLSQQRTIDPQLIFLLKDLKNNPANYPKDKSQMLLKPFKDSGQLEYLMKNRALLEQLLKTSQPFAYRPTYPAKPVVTQPIPIPTTPSASTQIRTSADRESPSSNPSMPQRLYNPHYNSLRQQKFKTVPCKYYHSHQGCSKTDNCTFIHDQKYAGQTIPNRYDSGKFRTGYEADNYPHSQGYGGGYTAPPLPQQNPRKSLNNIAFYNHQSYSQPGISPNPPPYYQRPYKAYTQPQAYPPAGDNRYSMPPVNAPYQSGGQIPPNPQYMQNYNGYYGGQQPQPKQ